MVLVAGLLVIALLFLLIAWSSSASGPKSPTDVPPRADDEAYPGVHDVTGVPTDDRP